MSIKVLTPNEFRKELINAIVKDAEENQAPLEDVLDAVLPTTKMFAGAEGVTFPEFLPYPRALIDTGSTPAQGVRLFAHLSGSGKMVVISIDV